MQENRSTRLVELEAVRGIAAVIVLLHHYLLAFAPDLHGRAGASGFALVKTPLFAFVNGSASVILFFVLSGFVLSVGAFRKASVEPVLGLALRRWPRLALPVVAANIGAAALIAGGLLYNHQAAALEHSEMLARIYSNVSPSPFSAAIMEGLFKCFLSKHAYDYNFVLWTMFYEFIGSYLVFTTTLLAVRSASYAEAIICAAALIVWKLDVHFVPMIAGVMIAHLYVKRSDLFAVRNKTLWWAIGAATVVLYGYDGYADHGGFYGFMAPFAGKTSPHVMVHAAAGCLIMFAVLSSPAIRRVLSSRVPMFLGRLSFPLYLTHVLVLASFSSWAATLLVPRFGIDLAAAVLLAPTILVVLLAAWPMIWLESWWLSVLRRLPTPRLPRATYDEQPAQSFR